VRDDAVRNVVYRIHEKNSLKVRRARYGPGAKGALIAGAAAASIAIAPLGLAHGADPGATLKKRESVVSPDGPKQPPIDPPHS
jgi:hypothetical protein